MCQSVEAHGTRVGLSVTWQPGHPHGAEMLQSNYFQSVKCHFWMFSSNGTFYLAATTSGGEQYTRLGRDEEGTAHEGVWSLIKDEVSCRHQWGPSNVRRWNKSGGKPANVTKRVYPWTLWLVSHQIWFHRRCLRFNSKDSRDSPRTHAPNVLIDRPSSGNNQKFQAVRQTEGGICGGGE